MRQIVTPWESFIGEVRNLAERISELGHNEFADGILLADERQDMEELMHTLSDITNIYQGEDEEKIKDVAAALKFRGEDIVRHHVEYRNGVGEWLPMVPYGLAPYGLVATIYEHIDGHMLTGWAFPGAPVSKEYGALLITYDYLEDSEGDDYTGLRVFFQEIGIVEPLESLVDEYGEIIISPSQETHDIAVYKCIIPDKITNSVSDTLDIIRDSLFDDSTLEILEAAARDKVILKEFPNGASIPNVF